MHAFTHAINALTSIHASPHPFHSLQGPSGSGKTSFLRAISNRVTAPIGVVGDVVWSHSTDATASLSPKDVAFVYQDDAFFSKFTVRETLEFARALAMQQQQQGDSRRSSGAANQEPPPAVDDVIKLIGLERVAGSFIGTTSSGSSGGKWGVPRHQGRGDNSSTSGTGATATATATAKATAASTGRGLGKLSGGN
jgi:ABC-type multidrug transport system ATPase subunit